MLKPLTVTVTTEREGEVVLAVSGDFDIRSADEIAVAVSEAETSGPRRLVLDLSEVTFMDSVALAVMIGARERARGRGAAVVVRAGRGPVRELLRIVGLTELLEDPGAPGA
jgi:anti-sigma B factor antagonist